MKPKTIIIVVITVLVTIIIMQNNEPMSIKLLWKEYQISKLLVLLTFSIIGLIVGLMLRSGRGKKGSVQNSNTSALSEEDREFIE